MLQCLECPGLVDRITWDFNNEIDNTLEAVGKQWRSRINDSTSLKWKVSRLIDVTENYISTFHKCSFSTSKNYNKTLLCINTFYVFDVSGNYTLTIQNEIESFHSINKQASVHQFI